MDASIYDRSKTLRRIEESMTDLVLCELIGTKPTFASALTEHVGIGGADRSSVSGEASAIRRLAKRMWKQF
jgi:hypothetical protein